MEDRAIDVERHDLCYNETTAQRVFKYAIKENVESSLGSDEITYNMIKQAYSTCLKLVLKIYNKILVERVS